MGRLQRAAARLYRASLLLYPAPFRRAWGQQLAETFRDGSRDAARRGPAALARFWGRVVPAMCNFAAARNQKGAAWVAPIDASLSVRRSLSAIAARRRAHFPEPD